MWLNRRFWLSDLLLVQGTKLNGPFIGGGVPRKAIPSIGLHFPISGFSLLASDI